MSRILHAVRFRTGAIFAAVVVAALLSVGAASAEAGSEIEGVWSFNNGQVDIQPTPGGGGKFEGIVSVATQFAQCPHTAGERMWTEITRQPNGSYIGHHQWFLNAPKCEKNPVLGPTAWRVLKESNGSRYLRVCFSHPGSTQPTIAADGAPKEPSEYAKYGVTYGCYNSALTSGLPVVGGTSGTGQGEGGKTGSSGSGGTGPVERLTLPSAKQCLRPARFEIRLREPKYDPFKTVTVSFKGHRLATSHKGDYIVATIDLKGLHKDTFKVDIHATTVLGHRLSRSRTYHLCGEQTVGPKKKAKKKRGKKG
jgi:hypothetical protein